MTRAQINDTLLQIANLEGQIKVHEDTIEQLSADLECLVFYTVNKNSLDGGDLREINSMRSEHMVASYLLTECHKKIISLKKAASIDLDEADKVYDE